LNRQSEAIDRCCTLHIFLEIPYFFSSTTQQQKYVQQKPEAAWMKKHLNINCYNPRRTIGYNFEPPPPPQLRIGRKIPLR
jgi:hypothetical protein